MGTSEEQHHNDCDLAMLRERHCWEPMWRDDALQLWTTLCDAYSLTCLYTEISTVVDFPGNSPGSNVTMLEFSNVVETATVFAIAWMLKIQRPLQWGLLSLLPKVLAAAAPQLLMSAMLNKDSDVGTREARICNPR
jgi:hypothetical protein